MIEKGLKRIALKLITILSILIILFTGLTVFAKIKQNETVKRWRADHSDLYARSKPEKQGKNRSAQLLDDLFNSGQDDQIRLETNGSSIEGSAKVLRFLLDNPANELPEHLVQQIRSRSEDFGLAYKTVRESAPQWDLDTGKGIDSPTPNLSDHERILSTLCLDALVKSKYGRNSEALEAFQSAWEVNSSIRSRPELISQMLAISSDTTLINVLKRLNEVPEAWKQKLSEHDYRRSLLVAFTTEARFASEWYGMFLTSRTAEGSMLADPLDLIASPYLRLCGVEVSENIRTVVKELQKDWISSEECKVRANEFYNSLSWWNLLGQSVMPNLFTVMDPLYTLEDEIRRYQN
jgi:hypothetical protein